MASQPPSSSDAISSAVAQARELPGWIRSNLGGVEVKGDHRHRISAQLFDLAIDHQAGIALLLASKLYASAFALVRCEYECFIRGAWLHHCATDGEIKYFVEKDDLPLGVGGMIDALEKSEGFGGDFLSQVKSNAWKAMNGYVHGGMHPISRRLEGDHIEQSFQQDELLEVARFSARMAVVALGEIANLAERKDLWEKAEAKMAEV